MHDSDSSSYSYSDDAAGQKMPSFGDIKKKIENLSFLDIFEKNKKEKIDFCIADAVAVIFFAFIGVFSRTFRIYYPNKVVFDEVRYGDFINHYINQEYFDDTNPPLGKLILAGACYILNYQNEYDFKSISESDSPYPSFYYASIRIVPALFSGLVVPLSYIAARFLNLTTFASFSMGIFMAFDLLFIVEGRFIFIDGILHFFCMLSLVSIFFYDKKKDLWSLLFEGFCIGLAISVKFTAGGILLFAIVKQFDIERLLKKGKQINSIKRSLILILTAFFVLYVTMYIHIAILPFNSNTSDDTPKSIASALVDRRSPEWNMRYHCSMPKRIFSLLFSMLRISLTRKENKEYSTKWYQWPLVTCKLLPYAHDDGKYVYAMGNILIWAPTIFSIVFSTFSCIFNMDCKSLTFNILVGFYSSYLPFAFISADTFIYHYCIPLIFGYLSLAYNLDKMQPKYKGFFCMSFIFCTIAGFLLWAPFAYDLSVPGYDLLVWNRYW